MPISVSRAGADDDAEASSVGDESAGEGEAEAVAEVGVFGDGVGVFFHRHGFAGEEGFVDAQAVAFEEAEVGGDAVTGFEQDDVAGDELGGVEGLFVSVAADHGFRRKHGADGIEGFFGFAFLDDADEGVDEDDAEDDAGVDPFAEEGGADGGGEKDVDEDVVELEEEALEECVARGGGQLVGSVPGEAGGGFGRGEPFFGIRCQLAEDGFGFCRVPVHRGEFIVHEAACEGNLNRLPRGGWRGMMRGDENFVFRATAGGRGCG